MKMLVIASSVSASRLTIDRRCRTFLEQQVCNRARSCARAVQAIEHQQTLVLCLVSVHREGTGKDFIALCALKDVLQLLTFETQEAQSGIPARSLITVASSMTG